MKIKVQLVLCAEDGREEEVQEIAVVEKLHQRIEHLGFTLAEAKSILSKRFCKRQQMQWTRHGAHLLLQTRAKTLHQELATVFQRWYPDLQLEEEPLAA